MLSPETTKPPDSSPKDQTFGFYVNMPSLFKLLFVVFIVVPLLVSLGYCYLYLFNFWFKQAGEIVVEDPNIVTEEGWIEFEEKMKEDADFNLSCFSNMYNCTPSPWDGKVKSLPWMRRCDGNPNCWDGSDEKNCNECLTSFSCKAEDGIHLKCLNGHQLCNGFADCPDASDELRYCHRNTTCADDEFSCDMKKNGERKCFPNSFKCDGDLYYCHDGTLLNCTECQGYSRQCKASNGVFKCSSLMETCNGRVDCIDHRDESFFHCNKTVGDCPGQCNLNFKSDKEQMQLTYARWRFSYIDDNYEKIQCSDHRFYSPLVGCSGESPACDGHCNRCIEPSFHCTDELKCIPNVKVCNGINDCLDGFDEKDCNETLACDDEKNRCNGACNCLEDCRDEKNCTECQVNRKIDGWREKWYMEDFPKWFNKTSVTSYLGREAQAFNCPKEKTCVPISKRCDGRKDCSDGQDELECECFECMMHPHETYMCQEGKRCFRFDEVCDKNFESQCPNATKLDVEHCELLGMKSEKVKLY